LPTPGAADVIDCFSIAPLQWFLNATLAILFPFARKFLALKCLFCTLVCDADGGRLLLFNPQNEKLCKVAKERVQQLTLPGRDI
jgi:hypothetical protein